MQRCPGVVELPEVSYRARADAPGGLSPLDRVFSCRCALSGLRLGAVHTALTPAPDTALNIATWARDALGLTTGLSGVHRVGLALTEGGGRRLRFTASDRSTDAGVEWCHVDAYDEVPLNTAVRTGNPVLGSLDGLSARYPGFVERQRGTATVALAAVPIVTAGHTLGGYVLFFDHPQGFDPAQLRGLARLGADLGAALRRAQRHEARPHEALTDEAVPAGALVAFHDVPSDPAAVAQARRFLRHTMYDWDIDEETTDAAELCLSELVTNAVVHAHSSCSVRVLLEQGILTTTVRDNGTPEPAAVEHADDPLRVHGRGLEMVDVLATRWGSELDTVGTTVWFVLEL
jgi:anti-sigma regulatory factor (Ser/Thr protein kinase)